MKKCILLILIMTCYIFSHDNMYHLIDAKMAIKNDCLATEYRYNKWGEGTLTIVHNPNGRKTTECVYHSKMTQCTEQSKRRIGKGSTLTEKKIRRHNYRDPHNIWESPVIKTPVFEGHTIKGGPPGLGPYMEFDVPRKGGHIHFSCSSHEWDFANNDWLWTI